VFGFGFLFWSGLGMWTLEVDFVQSLFFLRRRLGIEASCEIAVFRSLSRG
jgi:hypothetical protein